MQSDLDVCLSLDNLCFTVRKGLCALSYGRQPLPVVTASLLLFLRSIRIGQHSPEQLLAGVKTLILLPCDRSLE